MKVSKLTMLFMMTLGLCLTACNDSNSSISQSSSDNSIPPALFTDEVSYPADDYEYHQWTNVPPYRFLSSIGFQVVAEYKTMQPIVQVTSETQDTDGYYHCYLSIPYATDEEPTFPEKGTFKYSQNAECDILLVNVIGRYTTYNKYYYSESLRVVKNEQAVFKSIDVKEPEKMQGKTILDLFLTNTGELMIVSATPPSKNIGKIEPFEKTTYYKVNDDVTVTFDNPQ